MGLQLLLTEYQGIHLFVVFLLVLFEHFHLFVEHSIYLFFCFVVKRCLYAINWSILFCGIRKPPDCTPFPDIFLTICLAPSLAAPAKADKPIVFANVGAKALPNRLPPICFLIFVLASFISIPLFSFRFFSNLFTVF